MSRPGFGSVLLTEQFTSLPLKPAGCSVGFKQVHPAPAGDVGHLRLVPHIQSAVGVKKRLFFVVSGRFSCSEVRGGMDVGG